MYELTVEAEFCAAHALLISGQRETLHGHNWHVTVCVAGGILDDDGLLCDFHTVEEVLAEVIGPFQNANLNTTPPFDRENPSAENVARHIGVQLSTRLDPTLSPHAGVAWVRVTEATHCAATYRLAKQ
ncbi:MAG: 6-carboxytetrahydropterin synthase [Phycisphaerales bacterium]|nr:6-carboxytetrahydropterin synthase [Phycisphaerales bacterium]